MTACHAVDTDSNSVLGVHPLPEHSSGSNAFISGDGKISHMAELPNATATILSQDAAFSLENEYLFAAVFLLSVLVVVWLLMRNG
jgi:hypothetical protein